MPATKTSRPRDVDRPTLLMVGSGEPMDAALRLALDRHGLFVEAVGLEDLRPSVQMTAPDLILLLGDAAEEGGVAALSALGVDAASAAVPVILLAPDAGLESRMHAFRHGAMAVVPRSASPDGIARKIAGLTRELSEHFEERTGEIGEATFEELVDLVKKELRSGILSVHAPNHKGGPMRLVLGAGRPVAQAVHEFVARLKPHVTAADAMYYQFHTSAGGPVELLDMEGEPAKLESLSELRILLVDDDPARADALAQELRARGALIFVTDSSGRGIERAIGLDPQVAIIDAAGLEGPGFEVVRAIRKDLRLRWASILVAPWEEIWPRAAAMPDIDKLVAKMEPLLVPERELAERAQGKEPFGVRLESTGPGRMLRVLVESGATLHLTIRNPKAVVEVDLAQGLLVGAIARTDGQTRDGTAAIGVLLTLGSARVHVERRPNPAVANVMTPVDEALAAASHERAPSSPPVAPSVIAPPAPLPKTDPAPVETDRWGSAAERFPELADDDPSEETQVKNLEGLAKAGEALLVEVEVEPEPATEPAPAPKPPNQPQRKRRATLALGSPLMSPLAPKPKPKPPPEPPAAAAPPEPPSPNDAPTARPPAPPAPSKTSSPTPSERPTPAAGSPMPAGSPPVERSTPPPPEPEPAIAPEPPIAAPPEPTMRVPTSTTRPRRKAGRRLAWAAVVLASLVFVTVLALIGYRHSGLRHPEVDRVLVLLGAPPPAPPPEPEPEAPLEAAPDPAEATEADPAAELPPEETVSEEAAAEEAEEPVEEPAAEEPAEEAPIEQALTEDPVEEPPGDPEATTIEELLDAARRTGSDEAAERIYRRILELEPREHHAMVRLAVILMDRDEPAEAVQLLEGAVERRPRRARYRVLLGDALAAAGDAAGARSAWERALESDPDNARALRRLGR